MTRDNSKLTPMMKQYFEIKEQVPDATLFFRMGDFYEIFDTDALEVAPILDIALTAREKGDSNKIPFCGVPHHSVKQYIYKLVRKGYSVAICDQMESPAEAKGIVKRGITRIITPGSIEELDGLEDDKQNYLLSFYEEPEKKSWSMLAVDVSVGLLKFEPLSSSSDVLDRILRYRPKEILIREFFKNKVSSDLEASFSNSSEIPKISIMSESHLRSVGPLNECLRGISLNPEIKTLLLQSPGSTHHLNALFGYLETLHVNLKNFRTLKGLEQNDSMQIGVIALRDLEIFETIRGRSQQGSLFQTVNYCATALGSRLLRDRFLKPSMNPIWIQKEHSLTKELIELFKDSVTTVHAKLKGCHDIERLYGRVLKTKASPSELFKLRRSLRQLQEFSNSLATRHLSTELKEKASNLSNLSTLLELLDLALSSDDCWMETNEIFKEGYSEEYDRLQQIIQNMDSKLQTFAENLREESGISTLKLKPHKNYGLLIEVTKSHLSKVPETFSRKQTLTNCERYLTPELAELNESFIDAKERIDAFRESLYLQLLNSLETYAEIVPVACSALAELDVIFSFTALIQNKSYIFPETLKDNSQIQVKASRHSVVESIIGSSNFRANDFELSSPKRVALLTGPNMAGKSTYMRQIALIALLHQIGCPVPATSAKLPVFDQIFTRIGASDDLAHGQSTFFVEMSETADILCHGTDKSLIIVDEIGRGTSSQDGMALAEAILNDLSERVAGMTLFATHYHELTTTHESNKKILCLKTEFDRFEGKLRFPHKISEGVCPSSFGIDVAEYAGIPNEVILEATKFVEKYQSFTQKESEAEETITKPTFDSIVERKTSPTSKRTSKQIQKELFSPEESVLSDLNAIKGRVDEIGERLDAINIPNTTPLQALVSLSEIVKLWKEGESWFSEIDQLSKTVDDSVVRKH